MSAVRLQFTPDQAEEQLAMELEAGGYAFERQYLYVPGRWFRSDFAFPAERLLVEVQGGVFTGKAHGSVSGVLRDNERLNLATLHGWRVLRYTPDQVLSGEAFSGVEEVLRSTPRTPTTSPPGAATALDATPGRKGS